MRYRLTFLFLLGILFLSAQEQPSTHVDSSVLSPNTIPLSLISIKSSDDIIWTKKLAAALLQDVSIDRIKRENDSLLFITDSLLHEEKQLDFTAKNLRDLNNRLAYWQQRSLILGTQKSDLSEWITGLNNSKIELRTRSEIWENTLHDLEGKLTEGGILDRVEGLIAGMDSIGHLIELRRDKLLLILDRTTKLDLNLVTHIEGLQNAILKREGELFVRLNPSLFNISWLEHENWDILVPIKNFYRYEVKQLLDYLYLHISRIIFQLIIIISLYFGFKHIRRRLDEIEIKESSGYLKILSLFLSHTLGAALILGLFCSVLIFPIRPALFIDITLMIVIVPLIIITKRLLGKSYSWIMYLVGFLVYFQMVIFIYPSNHLIYRLSLIFIALAEMLILRRFYLLYKSDRRLKSKANSLINFLLILNFGIAFTSIVGALSGATTLADFAVVIPIDAIFTSLLLLISVIIINGTIEFWTENSKGTQLRSMHLYGATVKKKAVRLINITAGFFWFYLFLRTLNIEKPVSNVLLNIFNARLNIRDASFSLGGIVTFVLVIWISILISRIVRTLLEKDVLNKLKLAKGLPHTIALIVRYSIVTVGVLLAVRAVGLPLDKLTVILGAFGVGIGFGLQNIFNNLVSGFILLFERPIQIGDTIEVGELIGNVKSIGIRSSNVRTFDGAEVIVPNGQLVSNEVINWTLSDQQKRLEIIAGVAYGSDPHKVKDLFMGVLEKHPDIIQEPLPMVLFIGLGESSLDFRLLFWTANIGEWLRIRSEVLFEIHDVLYAEGIQIPFPQRDLHIKSIDQKIEISEKPPTPKK